jgi:hypothetical protein
MGGIYSAVAEMAGGAAEKVASTFGSKVAPEIGEHIENGIYKGLFNPERSFAEHPYAAQVYHDIRNVYNPKIETETSQIAKKWQATGQHPITGQPTPLDLGVVHGIAKKNAYEHTFGPHGVVLQDMLKHVQADSGKNKSDVLADHLNVMFQEAPLKAGPNKGKSAFDIDMARGKEAGYDTPASPYKTRSPLEGGFGRVRRLLAFKAAPIHAASTGINMVNDAGLFNTYKTLRDIWGPSRQGTISRILASDAISEAYTQPIREHQAYIAAKQKNLFFKHAPGGIGEFVHRNMYIPGLNFVRRESLYAGANLGHLMAQEAAARLQAGDKKWALPALKEFDIDPAKLAQQGYQLAPEDIQKAYYHGANNKVFLHPYDDTPTFWRQSPLWRSAKAFTGYITKQSSLERRVVKRQFAQGDYLALGRNIALKSLVVPLVGSSIYEMDRLASGEDWDDPQSHLLNRYDATPMGQMVDPIVGRENGASMAKTTMNTIDMITRLGTFGNVTGYVRGMNRADLVERFMPPEANMAFQGLQDADKAIHYDSAHPGAAKPFGRDLLSDLIPYGGNILSHQLLPTKKEEDVNKIHRFRRSKPKPESGNPFNYNIDSNY